MPLKDQAVFHLFRKNAKKYDDLTGSTFKKEFESKPTAILIDVRRPSEFSAGTL
ncbi:hypothetical protein [uncultured Pontibacter sp.]|uniref:hypothetical protein n=1 Tax=uncultured Pontibacter sp. TaxID=453356 RepID=UPI00261058C5|nr:hypothetical protein [uncultured Pontibacter sp.]